MAKFIPHSNSDESIVQMEFQCPGCGATHQVRVNGPGSWIWNGNMDKPTISPSVFVDRGSERECHSFITDGKLQFLGDCWHDLKGQTVVLPDWESNEPA